MQPLATAAAAVLAIACAATAAPSGTAFVGAGLNSGTANFLDADLNLIATFDTGGTPNGATVGNDHIFIGDFSISGWRTYDLDGNLTDTVSAGMGLQGLTFADGNLLVHDPSVATGPNLDLYTPDGTFVRNVAAGVPTTIEGLAFDGDNTVYALETDAIEVYDFTTGTLLDTLINPAVDEQFGGTALTYADGALFVGGASGNWFQLDIATELVVDSGTSNTDLFGLGVIPTPGTAALLLATPLLTNRRRR